ARLRGPGRRVTAGEVDLQSLRRPVEVVQQPDAAPAVPHDARAICRGIPDVAVVDTLLGQLPRLSLTGIPAPQVRLAIGRPGKARSTVGDEDQVLVDPH